MTLFAAVGLTGWEFPTTPRQVLPANVRNSPVDTGRTTSGIRDFMEASDERSSQDSTPRCYPAFSSLASFWITSNLALSVRKEIEDDQNVALAILVGSVIIGLALIISAAIHS